MAEFQKYSERIRVVGIKHRDKTDKGQNRFYCEAELADGKQVSIKVIGNENLGKWCAAGKTFWGELRPDDADNRGGITWVQVWRDWDLTAQGKPRSEFNGQGQQRGGGGNSQGTSSGATMSLDVAMATWESIVKVCAGNVAKASAIFQKLDVRIPYEMPEEQMKLPDGYKAPDADSEIPF